MKWQGRMQNSIRSSILFVVGLVAAGTFVGRTMAQAPPAKPAPATAPSPTAVPTPAPIQDQMPQQPNVAEGEGLDTTRGFGGVGVESLDDLRSLIIEGPREQVDAIIRVIEEIDRLSSGGDPQVFVQPLQFADSEALSKALVRIFDSRDLARAGEQVPRGKVGFVPIAQPNAVVIVAQQADIEDIVDFVRKLDEESGHGGAQFKIFNLQRSNALQVQQKLQQFYTQREDAAGIRARVEIVADERTNSILVFAGPADLQQTEQLIRQLDAAGSEVVTDLQIFPLRNAVASELATLLQQAIVARTFVSTQGSTGIGLGQPQPITPGQQGQGGGANPFQGRAGQGAFGQGAGQGTSLKMSKLRFFATDKDGKPIESGILEDINVTADDRTNSLIVTAPATSMSLVAELIRQLDQLPSPTAELKVFTLRNADANAMLETLQGVFLQQGQQQGGGGAFLNQGGLRAQAISFALAGQEAPLSLAPLSFSVDTRTNSVIVSGSPSDLLAVEALVLKLDANNALERKTIVYRLRNLTASDAAAAIDQFLLSQADTGAVDGLQLAIQQQITREVAVVPEPVSNTLLISSTPRFFEEVMRIVEEIDSRPPQVVIQVLIAEVALNDDEDFGLELGTQSSVLFDRSLIVRNSTLNAQVNSLNPGFGFNTTDPLQSPVGANASEVGVQGLTNFALGRANPLAGFGGLILAASSDNVSILLRALKRQQRLEVLSRPQVMTLDNQQAFIQIGQTVPVVNGTQNTPQGGVQVTVVREDVGIILQVTPRISPDGVVVMRVDPTVSSLADQGIPIGTDGTGGTVEAPIINTTRAQTTISAADGQTVVIGGLISRAKTLDERKLPWVGDLPVVGWAFKTRFKTSLKRELLIILTPRIVYNECDAQRIKQTEAARINWIMSDVEAVHGDIGLNALECDDNCAVPGAIQTTPTQALPPSDSGMPTTTPLPTTTPSTTPVPTTTPEPPPSGPRSSEVPLSSGSGPAIPIATARPIADAKVMPASAVQGELVRTDVAAEKSAKPPTTPAGKEAKTKPPSLLKRFMTGTAKVFKK